MSGRTVHRFPLAYGVNEIVVAPGATLLSAGIRPIDDGMPSIWLEVPENGTDEPVTVLVQFIGTGHPVPRGSTFLGTAIAPSGDPLVWHVYRVDGVS